MNLDVLPAGEVTSIQVNVCLLDINGFDDCDNMFL